MNWRFWQRPTAPEPDSRVQADKSVPDLDLAELLSQPPPSLGEAPPAAGPVYLDDERSPRDRPVSEWARVDLGDLKRKREAKEAAQTKWARLKRGELSTADLPGQAAASNAFFGLAEGMLAPLIAIVQNPFVVGAVIVTAVAFAGAAFGIMEAMRWAFGDLMR